MVAKLEFSKRLTQRFQAKIRNFQMLSFWGKIGLEKCLVKNKPF